MSKYFIDISEHNTILSIEAIPKSHLACVIMKATEGTTYSDHSMEIYYDALKSKIPLGFYHFLTSTSSPKTQALSFWNRIKDKEFQILPVLDVEQVSLGKNAESYSKQFIQEFKKLSGQDMLIYSGRCYIEEHFSITFRKENLWWVADYSANSTPKINGCKVIAWQYTGNCRSYAFTMGDLDVSILENENSFFIRKEVAASSNITFKPSMKDIAILQNELILQGFKDENGKELYIDGLAGTKTLSACPTLKIGAKGNITKWVQQQLEILADGKFGENTRQAVIIYQENRSMTGDGIVGKNTWKKLLGL